MMAPTTHRVTAILGELLGAVALIGAAVLVSIGAFVGRPWCRRRRPLGGEHATRW